MNTVKSALLGLVLIAAPVLAQDGAAVWIDVRTAQEYAEGHVPGAVNIPHDRIAEGVAEQGLQLGDPIYVYCRSGNRSGQAHDALEQLGYRNVTDLKSLDNAQRKWEAEHGEAAPQDS